jgi:hypothetical protein
MFLEGRALSRPPLESATTERGPPLFWEGRRPRRPAVDPTALPIGFSSNIPVFQDSIIPFQVTPSFIPAPLAGRTHTFLKMLGQGSPTCAPETYSRRRTLPRRVRRTSPYLPSSFHSLIKSYQSVCSRYPPSGGLVCNLGVRVRGSGFRENFVASFVDSCILISYLIVYSRGTEP